MSLYLASLQRAPHASGRSEAEVFGQIAPTTPAPVNSILPWWAWAALGAAGAGAFYYAYQRSRGGAGRARDFSHAPVYAPPSTCGEPSRTSSELDPFSLEAFAKGADEILVEGVGNEASVIEVEDVLL